MVLVLGACSSSNQPSATNGQSASTSSAVPTQTPRSPSSPSTRSSSAASSIMGTGAICEAGSNGIPALGATYQDGIYLCREHTEEGYWNDWYASRRNSQQLHVESDGKTSEFEGNLTINCSTGMYSWADATNFDNPLASDKDIAGVVPQQVVADAIHYVCGGKSATGGSPTPKDQVSSAQTVQVKTKSDSKSPVRIELTRDNDIAITAVTDKVIIRNVVVNRGNCPVLSDDDLEKQLDFVTALSGVWTSGDVFNKMTAPEKKKFMKYGSEGDKGTTLVMMQKMEEKYLDKSNPEYKVIANPPIPKYPQELTFSSSYKIAYQCNRVIEVTVDTDQGSWTATWQ